ncbi:transmembrane protein 272-like [Ptychodera flava]|uniref:transmembrane protein 272-like n=1 Tax=Ptychodera flava TaxID=63121 RepID=UPI00396A1353
MSEKQELEQDVTISLEAAEVKANPEDNPPSYDEAQKDPPPDYGSIIGRIKQAKQDSSGVKDFTTSVCDIILGTTGLVFGCLICTGLTMGIPIAMIVIGSIYLDDCPAEKNIPIYLIVCGVFTILSYLLSVCLGKSRGKKDENAEGEGDAAGKGGAVTGCAGCISCLIGPFLFAWFIAGNVWIYRTYEPSYDDVNAADYCNKTLYLFSFWLLNVTYILIGLSCCIGICGCCVACIRGDKGK